MKDYNSKLKFFKFILFFIIFVFTVYFTYLSVRRVESLNSHYYDLGIMNQVVYNTSKGRILEMTNPTFLKNMSRFAIHFDPILAFFAPFYLIYPSYFWLLFFQTVIVGVGAYFLFLLGNKVIKNILLSFFISALYLCFFAVQRMILFDFHAVVLATTFFIASFYFMEIKKWRCYYLFIFLALLTKEHIGLIVLFLGFYIFFFKKEKKNGFITIILGGVFFILTTYLIIPYFRGDIHFAKIYFYNIKERLNSIIINGFEYFFKYTIPLFFVFLAPEIFLIASPEWGINILSINNNMRAIYFHYHAIIVAFLFIALIFGIKRFLEIVKNKKIKLVLFGIFLFINTYWIYLYNPFPVFVRKRVFYEDIHPLTKKSIKYWQENLKDENISVATTPRLAPFFTNRKYYYNFLFDPSFGEAGETEDDIIKRSDRYKKADYVIIYRKEIGNLDKGTLQAKFYQRLTQDSEFEMIYSDSLNEKYGGSIEVYKKIK